MRRSLLGEQKILGRMSSHLKRNSEEGTPPSTRFWQRGSHLVILSESKSVEAIRGEEMKRTRNLDDSH